MASMDEATLEFFVLDSLLFDFSKEDLKRLVKVLEPIREEVENMMNDYDEEEHSWRDYRYGIWSNIEAGHPLKDNRFDILAEKMFRDRLDRR